MHDLVAWCGERGFDLTFIEVMPMGDLGNEDRLDQYWSLRDLRRDLETRWTLTDTPERTGGPARYVRVAETGGRDRLHHAAHPQFLRMLQPGAADLHRPALHVPRPGGRRRPARRAARPPGRRRAACRDAIRAAIARKPKGHDFDYSRQTVHGQVARHMSHTGG